MQAFFEIINYLTKAIGITHDEELPVASDSCKALPPRLSAREPSLRNPEEKQASFFDFCSLFSFFTEKANPESQLSASIPSYGASFGNASILLPHYLRTHNAEKLEGYFKDNKISCINLDDLGLKKSPLTAAARQGKVDFTRKLLPYVVPKNAEDALSELARMPSHERDHPAIIKCGKALAKHMQAHRDYVDALDLNEEGNFSREEIDWRKEMGTLQN